MIKIARYNQEQKRFEIESTGCEDMDGLVDSGHEALHTRERIKLFDDSVETGTAQIMELFREFSIELEHQIDNLKKKQNNYDTAFNYFIRGEE